VYLIGFLADSSHDGIDFARCLPSRIHDIDTLAAANMHATLIYMGQAR